VRSTDAPPAIRTRIVSESGEQTVSGTVFAATGGNREGRLTEINDFRIEAIPRGHMLVMHNRDVPGVIGRIGTILGDRGINISEFHLGRRERGGEAMAVIEIDAGVGEDTLESLRSLKDILTVREIKLT
jgi:D-3-phosphoglycerate dehydrogenase